MTANGQMPIAVASAATLPAHPGEEPRSPRWESTRRLFLAKWPQCAVCAPGTTQGTGGLNVHHVVPVEFVRRAGRPDLELDERRRGWCFVVVFDPEPERMPAEGDDLGDVELVLVTR